MKLRTITNSFDEFFFKPQPVHNVALMRIFFGIIVLFSWFGIWKNLDTFWGVDGILSISTAMKYGNPLRFSLFEIFPEDPRLAPFLSGVLFVAALFVVLGLFTRTSLIVTFLVLLSFHERNSFVLNSADVVLRNFLFLLIFSPCGKMYSLDRWMAHRRGVGSEISPESSPWALRLMQIQFSVIYISTVLFKMKGSMWADGTAVYFATRLDEFFRFPLGVLNNLIAIKLLTWSTLVVELALGTVVWIKEFRYWVLLAGVALHLGIEVTMSIPLFEWIMIAAMLCVVEPADILKGQRWISKVVDVGNRWMTNIFQGKKPA